MSGVMARAVQKLRRFRYEEAGASAVEFAIILPMMLVLFFGTVELSNGVAVDRKVTLTARTLSDLVSQASTISDNDLTNSFAASSAIMTPYSAGPVKAVISEVKVDASGVATIAWSKSSNATARAAGSSVPNLPTALAVPGTYLIWSEVSYTYTPVVGYVLKTGLTLNDQFFTRPRQSACVLYNQTSCP